MGPAPAGRGRSPAAAPLHVNVRLLLLCQQPTFEKFTTRDECSAAWSASHLKHVVMCFVSSEMLNVRC